MTAEGTLGETLPKLTTGIMGLHQIGEGGLPSGRATLVAGTAGSCKTLLGLQFLYQGAAKGDEHGVLVSFEEPIKNLIRNVRSFGWDLSTLIEEGKLATVEATADPQADVVRAGSFDLSGLLARIEHAVRKVRATRIVLDSIGAIFPQFADSNTVRRELKRIVAALDELGLTALISAERIEEYGAIARFGIEEFVTDNVIILRNALDNKKRRRTMEILKLRGTTHQKGEFPFTVDSERGLVIIPLSSMELQQKSSDKRISSGNEEMDAMCGGGMFRDSIILVSGSTGTGKTLMTTEFIHAAIRAGEKALLLAFEESREQLVRNAKSWGIDYVGTEKAGLLKIVCRYPESMGLEDHLIHIKREIDEWKPQRVGLDSMSALERVSSRKSFREFVIGVTSEMKTAEVAGLFTNTTSMLMGSESITETHISTITDSIILLRYVELQGTMRRGVTVLKMRGSMHDKDIREYTINGSGMHIGAPFVGISGILAGAPVHTLQEERGRLDEMFGK